MSMGRVLVTGGNGFLAQHLLVRLSREGFTLRATVRSASRAKSLYRALSAQGLSPEQLEISTCDLDHDQGWERAVSGCRFVMHAASPVPARAPNNAQELIAPARDGTLRVLRAAAKSSVERVVLTSSLSAVIFNEGLARGERQNEADWTEPAHASAYEQSKTLAERAAWDFVRATPLELSVINPGLILGPVLGEGHASSVQVVRRLLAGKLVGLPRIGWAVVDVRDVAEAHVRAMLLPEARGLRFCCAGEHAWLSDMATILAQHYESRGYRVPRRVLPDWLVRALSLVDQSARLVVHKLGQRVNVSSERAKNLLGLAFRPLEESVVATADSLIAHAAV